MRSLYTAVAGLAPEGWLVIALLAIPASFAVVGGEWALAALGLLPLPVLLAFFHDAQRHSKARPMGIVAPVDGVVVFRRECHDPYLGREAIRIRIRADYFGDYILRAPVEGEVLALGDASLGAISRLHTDEGEDVLIRVASGSLLGLRPVWAPYGERVGQGRRCGVRRLVRELELLIPAHARVEVALGDPVRCGETLLATLLRKP